MKAANLLRATALGLLLAATARVRYMPRPKSVPSWTSSAPTCGAG